MMTELGLTFVAGLLGSSHCVGMCGGLTMILSLTPRGRWHILGRQLAFSAGRIFTYSVLGGLAGVLGQQLAAMGATNGAVRVAGGLCVLAGLFLMVEGLTAAGFTWRRKSVAAAACGGCLSGPLFSTFLRAPGLHSAFLAGLLTGFLPCGLVYAFLALAAARTNPLEGMALMGAFGLLKAAAVCVVVTGAITVVRGTAFLRGPTTAGGPACPFCSRAQPSSVAPR
jgi:sulfite exporter TauE/SafE